MSAIEENKNILDPLSSHKKTYNVTSDESRRKFMELWNSGTITIKEVRLFPSLIIFQAATACNINYSTAKSIVKLSKLEGRVEKKKKRVSKRMKHE
jgi:predicted transcriptional regulator